MKKSPNILRTVKSSHELKLTLQIPADSDWFKGHYDEFQFLPGMALVLWAEEYLRIYLAPNVSIKSVDNVNFLFPITPNTITELVISTEPEDGKLSFKYTDPNAISPKVFAKGQLRV